MIELHTRFGGRADHVLVDADGWVKLKAALAAGTTGRPTPGSPDLSRLWGIDVFRDECPCDEKSTP